MRTEQATPTLALCGASRAVFDRWAAFARSGRGPAALFLWATAETLVWPVMPDALLVPLAASAPGAVARLWLTAVGGNALGSALLSLFGWWRPAQARAILVRLPGVQPWMLERANRLLAERGLAAFWLQPWTGISLKIFGVLAAGQRFAPWQVVPIAVAARALRLALSGGVAALLGWRLRRGLRDGFLFLALAYVLLGGYGWWVTQIRRQTVEPAPAER